MTRSRSGLPAFLLIAALASGCASYRTDSNIPSERAPAAAAAAPAITTVLIAEDALPNRKYKVIGPIEVSVKKLTAFHANPTKAMANEQLIEKARIIGADAVINVTYKSGIGFTTWGYMDATGTGVKLSD